MDKQSKALITFNDEPEDAISALNSLKWRGVPAENACR